MALRPQAGLEHIAGRAGAAEICGHWMWAQDVCVSVRVCADSWACGGEGEEALLLSSAIQRLA